MGALSDRCTLHSLCCKSKLTDHVEWWMAAVGFCGCQVPSHYHTCDLYRIMRAYKAKEALRLDNLQQGECACV
jgi:hypothetical protein